jgi:mRNA interferase RelE/StbE
MQTRETSRFARSYGEAPPAIQRAFDKQVRLLVSNLRHPSLRAKKYDPGRGIWQARVTRGWRFYFLIEGEACILLDIIPHPK